MSRPILVAYAPPGARHALLRGHWRPLLDDLNTPAQWSALNRGWTVRIDRLPDLLALAEAHGRYLVQLHERKARP